MSFKELLWLETLCFRHPRKGSDESSAGSKCSLPLENLRKRYWVKVQPPTKKEQAHHRWCNNSIKKKLLAGCLQQNTDLCLAASDRVERGGRAGPITLRSQCKMSSLFFYFMYSGFLQNPFISLLHSWCHFLNRDKPFPQLTKTSLDPQSE